MRQAPTTVENYLEQLPADRRAAIAAVRNVILKNLPKGYQEGIQYGMIGYFVPHTLYPAGYHANPKEPLPFAALSSMKNHMALYLMCVYGQEETATRFREAFLASGKKLEMGKACVRFKKVEDLPLDVIGRTIAGIPVKRYCAAIEASLADRNRVRSKA